MPSSDTDNTMKLPRLTANEASSTLYSDSEEEEMGDEYPDEYLEPVDLPEDNPNVISASPSTNRPTLTPTDIKPDIDMLSPSTSVTNAGTEFLDLKLPFADLEVKSDLPDQYRPAPVYNANVDLDHGWGKQFTQQDIGAEFNHTHTGPVLFPMTFADGGLTQNSSPLKFLEIFLGKISLINISTKY